MAKSQFPYVRCFWAGTLFLTNGKSMAVHCTHISRERVEVEAPGGLQGSTKVKLELQASNNGKQKLIKAICLPSLDVLNEHDKHYIKMIFHNIAEEDKVFIDQFVKAHS
ncbi:hypothetical protein ACFQ45_03265 [Rhodanobacter aciditrophus]|uniref:PilZ domain-containing protein n=1 Tax=Rhodanobacter aciditrophus TaxID=1623218 RepID=A0ABW4AWW0_9GAMM